MYLLVDLNLPLQIPQEFTLEYIDLSKSCVTFVNENSPFVLLIGWLCISFGKGGGVLFTWVNDVSCWEYFLSRITGDNGLLGVYNEIEDVRYGLVIEHGYKSNAFSSLTYSEFVIFLKRLLFSFAISFRSFVSI